MNSNNIIKTIGLLVSGAIFLAGCAATQTVLDHGSLQVSTKQSETIFLKPVPAHQKTVYLSVKNTSDEVVDITPQLRSALSAQGYKVVTDAEAAHYLLQANILKVGKMSIAASQTALGGGYGSVLTGAVTGTALGSFTHSNSGLIAGGITGGMLSLAADSLIKDVSYTMVTDVQISEKVGKGVRVNEQLQSQLRNGSSSITTQNSSSDSQYQRYGTRVVSNADKVNLKFTEARGALEQGLVKVISGIF